MRGKASTVVAVGVVLAAFAFNPCEQGGGNSGNSILGSSAATNATRLGSIGWGRGNAHKRFLFDFLTGNCCRPIPWQGFSCKGQTKSKAPQVSAGAWELLVEILSRLAKDRSEAY